MSVPTATARYVMIGGFLGAGKTTALAALARHLTECGLRVGLITNDQSTGLVDTALLRSHGFSVEEIAGGCFCCRFDSLTEAADRLSSESQPDVFLAEPVGSCTDLAATVTYPLRRMYGDRFTIAPLSVLVDPIRAARILGIETGRSFSEKVVYIYRKQLEEADVIVVNKVDLVTPALRDRLVDAMRGSFPRADIFCCSARNGIGLVEWFDRLREARYDHREFMALDYERYAEGEALLGWLNCTLRIAAGRPFDANEFLMELTQHVRSSLGDESCEIAHLKMTFDAQDEVGNLAVVSLVGSDDQPDLRESLLDRVDGGRVILNLRAEADPERLRAVTSGAIEAVATERDGWTVAVEHMECFRPAKPTPTHQARPVDRKCESGATRRG